MSTNATPETEQLAKRSRRAEPINTHTAKNGTVTYWFQLDLGTKPNGSRDRRKFTYRTKAEARKELRRISSDVAAGTYNRPTKLTVDEACEAWLSGRRSIRQVTVYSYEMDLKPVRRYLGARKLQALTKAGAGLPRIKLHGLRNTSVSLMLDQGHAPHIVAAWHGHDPAVTLSIYSDVKADELRAVDASLFR